jgi:hypothetical protein
MNSIHTRCTVKTEAPATLKDGWLPKGLGYLHEHSFLNCVDRMKNVLAATDVLKLTR